MFKRDSYKVYIYSIYDSMIYLYKHSKTVLNDEEN